MRNFMPMPNGIVLYECKKCGGYLPEGSFNKDTRLEFGLSGTCKSCQKKNKPLTYEEAVVLKGMVADVKQESSQVVIPAPVIVSAPEPTPEPTPAPEPTKPESTEKEMDKWTVMRYMKFYKNICRDSEDQFTVGTLWYYDTYMRDNFSKKDYRLARENIDNRFTQHLKDVDTSHLSNVREAFETIIKGAGKFYDEIQEEATNKGFDFQDYYTKNKESKLVYLTADWQRNLYTK